MRTLLAAILALAPLAISLHAADGPRITYTKVFPPSDPAYVKIVVTTAGDVTYQENPNEDAPERFQLDAAAVKTVFDLAAKLNRFQSKLESGLKVAKTGEKTFRWEDGATVSEQTFNLTTVPDARTLYDWFEKVTETERLVADLDHAYRYDRLGVNDVLLNIESAWQKKRIVSPAQFVPMLDRVHKNEGLINMARDRAATLSEAFQTAAP